MSFQALTIAGNGFLNVIQCKVHIAEAFDPSKEDSKNWNTFTGIWDTGASASVITQDVVDKCGLKPIGMAQVHTANGLLPTERYFVNIALPSNVAFANVMVTRGMLPPGSDMLIGMDIITTGDFVITNYNKKTVFSFRNPSMTKVDFVESMNKINAAKKQRQEIEAYSMCPCGSGKKYKFCCGKK